MRSVVRTKAKVISAFGAEEFENGLNEAFDEVGENIKRLIFNNSMEGHCAYIIYEYTERTPESARDSYLLDGDSYVCGECPFFVPSKDGRKTSGFCEHMHDHVRPKEQACTWLYRQLMKGEVEL